MEIYISLAFLLVIGFFSAHIAKKKKRNPSVWFFVGFIFGVIGLLVLLLLPAVKDEQNSLLSSIKWNSGQAVSTPTEPYQSASASVVETPLPTNDSSLKQTNWFYLDPQHQVQGPINFNSLLKEWIDGKISVKSYVWQEGMHDWQKIQDMPELKALLEHEEILYPS